jgi:hypothetical protein
MGATIAHGRELHKKREMLESGSEAVEIVPVEGDYDFPRYSSVEEMVEYARAKGIDPALWPIYYDVPPSQVDIEEIYQRCERIRQALSLFSREDISGNRWFKRVADWLSSGERFCITE